MTRQWRSAAFTRPDPATSTTAIVERSIGEPVSLPARLEGSLRLSHCASALGPLVVPRLSIVLSGLSAIVSFRDRPGRADGPRNEAAGSLLIVPSGERTPVRPGVSFRGPPGRSALSIRIQDRDGHGLTEERPLGECVDGVRRVGLTLRMTARLHVWVTAREFTERGPRLGVSGQVIVARGLAARLDFHPLAAAAAEPGRDAKVLPLLSPGAAWFTRELLLESGSPDRSWVFLRLEEDDGRVAREEHELGRCVAVQPDAQRRREQR